MSYENEVALRRTLEALEIEVVLSALSSASPGSFEAQVPLIRASAKSDSVKRFAPSEWLIDFEKKDESDEYVLLSIHH